VSTDAAVTVRRGWASGGVHDFAEYSAPDLAGDAAAPAVGLVSGDLLLADALESLREQLKEASRE
jgi:hypothetical protein